MAPEEVLTALVNTLQGDVKELKEQIRDMRKENSENTRRLHQRFDEMAQKDPVSRKECEEYRSKCKKGGHPTWVVVLFSLCSGLIMFILANWHNLVR